MTTIYLCVKIHVPVCKKIHDLCVYMYMCIYIYVYMYIYIYIKNRCSRMSETAGTSV